MATVIENATQPCPCGFFGDSRRDCRCSPKQVENYRQRISGPLLDRIDLHVEVPLVDYKELSSAVSGEKSESIRERVITAREVQAERFQGTQNLLTNASMPSRQVRAHCQLDSESSKLLEQAMEQLNFSARAYDRILKVARTLADLEGQKDIGSVQIMEAIQYRTLDRRLAF